MKAETIAVAAATAFFGLVVGWIIGSQQARVVPAAVSQPAAQSEAAPAGQAPKVLDEAEVQALRTAAGRDPKDAAVRTRLGDLYYDAERYNEAIRWYQESLKVDPKNADVSTDLGICFHYLGQHDRALEQFEYSLKVDPGHTKTLLNMGIVRAFGKQDLAGAAAIWQKLIDMAPGSTEAQMARKTLESLKAAHPEVGGATGNPKKVGGS
jgi:tetratricopeptide (TPR) repeat protein